MKATNRWNTVELTEVKFLKGTDDSFYYQTPNGELHRLYLQVHSPDGYTSVHVEEDNSYHQINE